MPDFIKPLAARLIESAKEWLFVRQTAYLKVFNGPYSDTVLRDLARFCRAHSSTFHPDPHVRCQLEGRREVWLRIANHLQLSDDELWKLHSGEKQP